MKLGELSFVCSKNKAIYITKNFKKMDCVKQKGINPYQLLPNLIGQFDSSHEINSADFLLHNSVNFQHSTRQIS